MSHIDTNALSCPTCGKSYVRRLAYDNHVTICAQSELKRQRDLRRAYPAYIIWFEQSHRSVPSFDTFADSRFGGHFLKFIAWCDVMSIRCIPMFISAMVTKKIHPSMWTTSDAYQTYIGMFESLITVEEWLALTADTIIRTCEMRSVPPAQFYSVVSPNEIVHLLRLKQLHPRFLICDPLFAQYLKAMPSTIATLVLDAIPKSYMQHDMSCDRMVEMVLDHVRSMTTRE